MLVNIYVDVSINWWRSGNSEDRDQMPRFAASDHGLHCLLSCFNICLFYVFQLTVADLAVYNIFDTRVMNDPEALDPYPSLKANRKATESNPRIAAYLKVRKHTDV